MVFMKYILTGILINLLMNGVAHAVIIMTANQTNPVGVLRLHG